jgi:hypothetical protein
VVREAIASAFEELEAEGPQREEEVARIDAEARKVGESLDRYFRAFEEGTMPESACGSRIDELAGKLRGWRRDGRSLRPRSRRDMNPRAMRT